MRFYSIMDWLFTKAANFMKHSNVLKRYRSGLFLKIRNYGFICHFVRLILTEIFIKSILKVRAMFIIKKLVTLSHIMFLKTIKKSTKDLFSHNKETESKIWRNKQKSLSQQKQKNRKNNLWMPIKNLIMNKYNK